MNEGIRRLRPKMVTSHLKIDAGTIGRISAENQAVIAG
jgi:hypothetical protein